MATPDANIKIGDVSRQPILNTDPSCLNSSLLVIFIFPNIVPFFLVYSIRKYNRQVVDHFKNGMAVAININEWSINFCNHRTFPGTEVFFLRRSICRDMYSWGG